MNRAQTALLRPLRNKGPLKALVDSLQIFQRRRRDRQLLGRLDPHLLQDIGLDSAAAAEESAKPFWRA